MKEAFVCDAIRTPFGRYGGTLATTRTDDLAAIPICALMERNPKVDWAATDDVVHGCANQAGEDNRNVGRMALLLAGISEEVPGTTVNRLCGSSMDAVAGVAPRIMGFAPAPASRKALAKSGLKISNIDLIELNEAFAAQALAVTRDLGLPDDAEHVNPNGGAIAIGHPLGASGARLITTATSQLHLAGARYALCTMCIGVGQGIAVVLERC